MLRCSNRKYDNCIFICVHLSSTLLNSLLVTFPSYTVQFSHVLQWGNVITWRKCYILDDISMIGISQIFPSKTLKRLLTRSVFLLRFGSYLHSSYRSLTMSVVVIEGSSTSRVILVVKLLRLLIVFLPWISDSESESTLQKILYLMTTTLINEDIFM